MCVSRKTIFYCKTELTTFHVSKPVRVFKEYYAGNTAEMRSQGFPVIYFPCDDFIMPSDIEIFSNKV
jgi:hypothetical protein